MRKLLLLALLAVACGQAPEPEAVTEAAVAPTVLQNTTAAAAEPPTDPYRPAYHFTPPAGWMNDPNGLIYFAGEYHLFYQHFPDGNTWGPMHWGHAVSTDLNHWEQLPIALYPDSLGYIFSGSAVVDWDNTSGLGENDQPPLVAIFTYHNMKAEKAGATDYESQGIAYSNDRGRSWTKFPGNPVLPNQGVKDFRDPKVHWDGTQWVMTLAAQTRVQFYGSPDLKNWSYLSEWGADSPNHDGVWECPDLIELTVGGEKTSKHVLLVSINGGAPFGGSGTMYFVGDWDGKAFTPDDGQRVEWVDYGRDNYAGVTFSDVIDNSGRTKVFMGWMSNWNYANVVPTETWRSAMTVARKLRLERDPDLGLRLRQEPIVSPRRGVARRLELDYLPAGVTELPVEDLDGVFEIDLTVDLVDSDARELYLTLSNEAGEFYRTGYRRAAAENHYFSDRRFAGPHGFSDQFAPDRLLTAKRQTNHHSIRLHALFDRTSAEVFCGPGEPVLTNIFFPSAPFTRAVLEVNGTSGEPHPRPGGFTLTEGVIYPLR